MSKKKVARRNRNGNKQQMGMARPSDLPPKSDEYCQLTQKLSSLFSRYLAKDVYLSLLTSELWLPNIGSQVKHWFCYAVFCSMHREDFVGARPIDNFIALNEFLSELYATLPEFPMLEDYVPEGDWGEVRYLFGAQQFHIFYGQNVERIVDFAKAFELLNESNSEALADLHYSLKVQDLIIRSINRQTVGDVTDIDAGHIEIPSEIFWRQCIEGINANFSDARHYNCSFKLVAALGEGRLPTNFSDFGNIVAGDTGFPYLFVEIDGRRFPLNVRGAIATVIEYWNTVGRLHGRPRLALEISPRIAIFLAQRFRRDELSNGPFQLVSRNQCLPYSFSGLLMGASGMQLILAIAPEQIRKMDEIEAEILKVLRATDGWAILPSGSRHAFQIRPSSGELIDPAEIKILLVCAQVATLTTAVRIPRCNAELLWLADFVTIFDSVANVKELEKFWSFSERHRATLTPFSRSLPDLFASFRDAHGELVGGAIVPTIIMLDPHWSSNWRHRELVEYWSSAPYVFPDDSDTLWEVETTENGIQRLGARAKPLLAWRTRIGGCTVYFVFKLDLHRINEANARVLEMFIHCVIDALSQRENLIADLDFFQYERITVNCDVHPGTEVSDSEEMRGVEVDDTLFRNWKRNNPAEKWKLDVEVNLLLVVNSLTDCVDARFEARCVKDFLCEMGALFDTSIPTRTLEKVTETASRRPRFYMSQSRRMVDTPDREFPIVPGPENYKVARRKLAETLLSLGINPGTYELTEARAVVDQARDAFRQVVHAYIRELEQDALARFCIEQIEALTIEYNHTTTRVQLSLNHEVNYDRSQAYAEARASFVNEVRNYRYLLECCLSMEEAGTSVPEADDILPILAHVDWLFVLYTASDTIYNDIDVAGIVIDDQYIPEVYYSETRDQQNQEFEREYADQRLGMDLSEEEDGASAGTPPDLAPIDVAFSKDLGFSFTQLNQAFEVLTRWATAIESTQLHARYEATHDQLIEVFTKHVDDIEKGTAELLISFLTLDRSTIRRLLSKDVDEQDVPVWDHNKRASRYMIRPIIKLNSGSYTWSALFAKKAQGIWTGSIAEGYLPADFDWPHVARAVRAVKEHLENDLEVRAYAICARMAPFVESGLDLKSRFPKEGFEQIGDYDVLAYWPALNRWLIVECKYNQPPFCLKDARRLRERIFGPGGKPQYPKIKRRREFFVENTERIRLLLKWPASNVLGPAWIDDVYISRSIYWWMRFPPYPVPTHFVRIDAFANWLQRSLE
jgi:hypothetical protein